MTPVCYYLDTQCIEKQKASQTVSNGQRSQSPEGAQPISDKKDDGLTNNDNICTISDPKCTGMLEGGITNNNNIQNVPANKADENDKSHGAPDTQQTEAIQQPKDHNHTMDDNNHGQGDDEHANRINEKYDDNKADGDDKSHGGEQGKHDKNDHKKKEN